MMLSEMMDVAMLEELLDSFASAVGMSAYAVDIDGPLTRMFRSGEFYNNFIYGSEEIKERCVRGDVRGGELAVRTGRPALYTVYSGLLCFAAPVIVEGTHVASLIGGYVLTEEPDTAAAERAAQDAGFEPAAYLNALKKVRTADRTEVDNAARLLYKLAEAVGNICGGKLLAQNAVSEKAKTFAELRTDYVGLKEQGAQMIENAKELSAEFDRIEKKAEVADRTVAMTDSVLNYIQNVATQMTLLGFNASIEAKHAGDAGAGFNVIAQEVRQLAEQTSSRIRSVEDVLNRVKSSIKNIEQELNAVGEKVNANIETVNELNSSISRSADKLE